VNETKRAERRELVLRPSPHSLIASTKFPAPARQTFLSLSLAPELNLSRKAATD